MYVFTGAVFVRSKCAGIFLENAINDEEKKKKPIRSLSSKISRQLVNKIIEESDVWQK